ncbi:MAG: SH3 domain-containing protein [Chloroflexi bacterium]|nr:SH3 domain-containing protein [Chloroflexota bacterium]MCC6891710.1 SH3 domain-containing protein [Anaerolineae bacterium]
MKKLIFILLALMIVPTIAFAQDATATEEPKPGTGIYVTTQDFSSLRAGPDKSFARIDILPPVVTLEAVGRTADTRWIQVNYNGTLGWVASILLVWTGDVTTLPVDGINPAPFVRRAGAVGVTIRETPIYRTQVTPEDQVGTIPAGVEVELTGRLGQNGFFRFQIKYQGQLYWVGSWNIRVTGGNYLRLLDSAYLFPYGRLILQLEENLAITVTSYNQIRDVWRRLGQGATVTCTPAPTYARRLLTDADVQIEPKFVPAVAALDAGITSINTAISSFIDLCNSTTRSLTQADIDAALLELADAERNLILASSLLEPLRNRNPLLATFAGENS